MIRISVAAFFALVAILPCAAQLKPASLGVVHTWGDLRAQAPITVASATCRLGINFDAAKLYGGVVLYCLAQGKVGRSVDSGNLGPFVVEVQYPPKSPLWSEAQRLQSASPGSQQPGGEMLFLKSIPLTQPGDYTITLVQSAGGASGTVATATFTVPNEPGPLWSPWPLNTDDGAVGILASDEEDRRDSGASGVANPSTGVAIPTLPGSFQPDDAHPPGANEPLPQLFPSTPDPGVKLQAAGSLLLVSLDHGIYPDYPDEKFLTRWWVNGQPFVPKTAPPIDSMYYYNRHNGMMRAAVGTHITFQVEFHPEILGAQKGDAIGVQLLLCPQGAEYSGPDPEQMGNIGWNQPDSDLRSVAPRLSNRVDFTYTGDPLRMAPLPKTGDTAQK